MARPRKNPDRARPPADQQTTLAMVEEREALLRSILETAPDAIITIDQDGIIQSFSRAAVALFGYAPGEVIGQNVNMLMDTPHREQHDAYLERYRKTGRKRIIGIGREVFARRKDGSVFPIHLSVGEVRYRDTHLFTGFIRDLTQRDRLEQELRQAQKMEAIGQLTGGLAHDFNNLLTVISANLEMLEMRIQDPESRELIAEAEEATMLGARLANRLLAFGRRQALDPKPADPNAIILGLVDLLRRSLGGGVEVDLRLDPDTPNVLADTGQFENMLLNLAINARDAMPKGGHLIIETHAVTVTRQNNPHMAPGRYVALAVIDTGTGMSPEVRERAFEPFFTTKETGKGTGLGLSMVYGFVKQSGGHVAIESKPGHGTTIRILLPVLEGGAGTAAETPRRRPRREPAYESILVVEDDPRVRKVSVRRLRSLGYTVLEAASGAAALAMLTNAGPIDVLFTDVVMPGMSGIELAEEVHRRFPAMKILLVSGFAEPEMREAGQRRTGAAWLQKPHDLKTLEASLDALLGRPGPSPGNGPSRNPV
jgi:PAS domain S-box-containing protein